MIASPLVNRAVVALLGALGLCLGGCCAHRGMCGPMHSECFAGFVPVCFGYSSTCWHPWPEECVTCPTFTVAPQPIEPLPAGPPQSPKAEVKLPEIPEPMPEPSPSDRAPPPEDRGAYAPPPPVLTVAPIVTPASLLRVNRSAASAE